ncbi:MAG: UDP-N-acetylglucosamine 2-epimerase (non-hydrolyzing) [Gemmatimonadetes bacterium]|nr:UDP-N-acetylglucosamine 2-epimerase (non-hydrolyzing) [Gemmatimonadota bacterium]
MTFLLHVVGARPNFMKAAPVMAAGRARGLEQVLVHTGQHYDHAMSEAFFADLGLARADDNLEVGSGTHAEQTARIMLGFEPVLDRRRPAWVIVYGDVNSTVACALVAAKKGVRIAHVEAGLRSHDWTMPEEVNRVVTDRLADLLLTPSRDGDANLRVEGIPDERIRFVGNVMVDTLLQLRGRARDLGVPAAMGLEPGRYVVVTLHRPSNVDDRDTLASLIGALDDLAASLPVCFAVHPRTRRKMADFGLKPNHPSVRLLEPLGYLETVGLVDQAALVLTDSGGLQEETTVLGVPCLTARPNTERPVTITEGTNQLVPSNRSAIVAAVEATLGRPRGREPRRPEGWDGRAGERVIDALVESAGRRPG